MCCVFLFFVYLYFLNSHESEEDWMSLDDKDKEEEGGLCVESDTKCFPFLESQRISILRSQPKLVTAQGGELNLWYE